MKLSKLNLNKRFIDMILKENTIIDVWHNICKFYYDHEVDYERNISVHMESSICGNVFVEISYYVGMQHANSADSR
jgi:hypothetical protein